MTHASTSVTYYIIDVFACTPVVAAGISRDAAAGISLCPMGNEKSCEAFGIEDGAFGMLTARA